MSAQRLEDAGKLRFDEVGKPAASAVEFTTWWEDGCRITARGAIDRVVIPAPGLALEKCAPVLLKLLGSRLLRRPTIKLINALAQCGIFLLQLRKLSFMQNKLVLQHSQAFLENHSRTPLIDEPLDLGQIRDRHV